MKRFWTLSLIIFGVLTNGYSIEKDSLKIKNDQTLSISFSQIIYGSINLELPRTFSLQYEKRYQGFGLRGSFNINQPGEKYFSESIDSLILGDTAYITRYNNHHADIEIRFGGTKRIQLNEKASLTVGAQLIYGIYDYHWGYNVKKYHIQNDTLHHVYEDYHTRQKGHASRTYFVNGIALLGEINYLLTKRLDVSLQLNASLKHFVSNGANSYYTDDLELFDVSKFPKHEYHRLEFRLPTISIGYLF